MEHLDGIDETKGPIDVTVELKIDVEEGLMMDVETDW